MVLIKALDNEGEIPANQTKSKTKNKETKSCFFPEIFVGKLAKIDKCIPDKAKTCANPALLKDF